MKSKIDLPNFRRNTALARKKMIAKSKTKGNTWRMSPFDPFLYNEIDTHLVKLQGKVQSKDIHGIVDGATDIINYCHMIIDNAIASNSMAEPDRQTKLSEHK